ncbi:phosphate-starvation-inducible protein PsiE [Enterococcus moraviensis ATCC BAA-383]|uniref:Protein PsiE n=1 Tax=Enterococcus moraviensis ATCC BAA-383 TaxID=1158609 RepID=R2R832_9ENTE|nr:phosphate-starvation-inducible protein PsiE [Enterococcus moraviensis]EOI05090.1 phosphate-starvation-inducible protein PsiE [Enterococcus moraviensis ATCC BAA-383]EOT63873.1 phosphate-starvation-inducible protein PsiE [Enterococcus moraviensis ATCC BAA-383]OJG66994.1 phosphate-starvation-inducible protein PsiE [Enterococcus moraviensis]
MKEDQRFGIMKKYVNWVLDVVLGVLALLILVFMIRQLIDISTFISKPMTPKNLSIVMQEVVAFFMLFEFIMMVIRYIQEGHHIPIRYLILICITAILRQLMVLHGDAVQTLLLSVSILSLVIVLFVLNLSGNKSYVGFKSHVDDKQEIK